MKRFTEHMVNTLSNVRSGCGLLVLLVFVQAGYGQDTWPSFRGDTRLTGVSTSDLPDSLRLLWTTEVGGGIESTAAIWEKTVFVGGLDGFLYAIELAGGKLKWKYKASDEIKSSPSVFDHVVYFGDEGGNFHAVHARTGEGKWTFRTEGGIVSSANSGGDRVLFGSYDRYLYCLSMKDGALLWKLETEGFIHGMPSVVDGKTLIAGCDGYLRVVNLRDGTEQTQVDLSDYVGASAAVLDGRAYVGTFGNQVLCIDLKRSEVLWKYEHPKRRFPFYASPAVTAGGVVVGGRDRMVHALHPQTGKPLWTCETGGAHRFFACDCWESDLCGHHGRSGPGAWSCYRRTGLDLCNGITYCGFSKRCGREAGDRFDRWRFILFRRKAER